MASKLYNYTKEELQNLLNESNSYADLLRKLNMSEHGGNRATLRKIINEYDLDLTKIDENRKVENLKILDSFHRKIKPLNEILVKDSEYKSNTLLKRLFKEGLKEEKCECCGITEWMNKNITFQLHHKDGDHHNNELSNLESLCPNCHSQTDNFAGKSSSKIPKLKKEQEKKKAQYGISEDGQRFYDGYGNYKILCPTCNENFMNKEAKMCKKCYEKKIKTPKVSKEELFELMKTNTFDSAAIILGVTDDTVSKWYKYYIDEEKKLGNIMICSDKAPSKEELKNQLFKFKSFVAVARIYDVTDNTVRKWCDKYGIPRHTKVIMNISDEEWANI
jgi:Zn finger protein HypA/HybF involved in hydrogenase expression